MWLLIPMVDVLTGIPTSVKEWLWLKQKLSLATDNGSCAIDVYLGMAGLVLLIPTVTENRGETEYSCRYIINVKGICPARSNWGLE